MACPASSFPRVLPDGTRNAFFLQRLKDKLGNKSNASSEVEYDDAVGWLVGEEGRGVRTIIEMVNMTRLDCALMAAGGMRIGTAHAVHHATHRSVFGKRLIDQPAMVNVLADLAVDSEAATTVVMRLAGAVDRAARGDSAEAAFRRVGLAVTKYWLCKRWSTHAAESLECLGGNGYVEDSGMPRLYREAPLVSIWEGSGNVAALDTLRAMVREPAAIEASSVNSNWPPAATRATTMRWRCCAKSSPTPISSSTGPGTSSSGWRCCCRVACCCATATPRWPTHSSRRGLRATGASPTARCRPASTPRPSSTAQRSADSRSSWAGQLADAGVASGEQQ